MSLLGDIIGAIKEPAAAIGRWFNPDRRREATKDGAIESANELFRIYRTMGGLEGNKGVYEGMDMAHLKKWERHFMKRFDRWRNG